MAHENQNDGVKTSKDAKNGNRVGLSGVQGVQGGTALGRPTSQFDHEGDSRGAGGEDPSKLRDPVRDRHRAGIPGTRVKDPSETLIQAFLDGDFETAYQSAMDLKSAYHEALLEAAHQRYRANFGTEVCKNCEGLKAGPMVVATCFQVEKCNFDSIHEGSESPYHLRVLDRLSLK